MPDGDVRAWPRVALGEVLRRRELDVIVTPCESYHFAGVQSFGRGVFRGNVKRGSEFSYPRLTRVRAGDVTFPKLMAWEGAIGVVPEACDGLVVSPEFPVFDVDRSRAVPRFLDLVLRSESFWPHLSGGSTGTNVRRRRLHPDDFVSIAIPLPPLAEQRRIADRVDELRAKIDEAERLTQVVCDELLEWTRAMVRHAQLGALSPPICLSDVLVHTPRPLTVAPSATYREIGTRSFGKGIFHKPAVSGLTLGEKKMFSIEPGDLVVNIVFAWEGAVAIAGEGERGMVASHRFPTFRARTDTLNLRYLLYFLNTRDGRALLDRVSPGGAGRNRTLSRVAFLQEPISLPGRDEQDRIVGQLDRIAGVEAETSSVCASLNSVRSAIIERAVRGEL